MMPSVRESGDMANVSVHHYKLQGQHNLRYKHPLLILPVKVPMVLFHHFVHAHQAKTVVAAVLGGQIQPPYPLWTICHGVHHIDIKLPFHHINVHP